MKRLSFSLLIITVLSFILVQSCSTDEEETITPTVQTLEPEEQVKQYTLTVTSADGGTVSTEGGEYVEYSLTVEEGTEVTITAMPDEGHRFTGWEGNDSTNESLTITLNADQTLRALFELIPPVQYTLTVTSAEGGTVSSEGGTYDEGTEITITAIPSEGYSFVKWIEPNGSTWGSSNLNVTMNRNQTFQALFELNLLSSLEVNNLDSIISDDDFIFYYNISDGLPIEWANEFTDIMKYLNTIIPVNKRQRTNPRDGKSEMHIFAWNSIEESPYKDIIGDDSGACICGNQYGRYMLLEIYNDEFIWNHIHRYTVIVHEYFHVFQINESNIEPPYFKFLMEGGAASLESLYTQQHYNYNYFLDAQTNVTEGATNTPNLYEDFVVAEINYADSVFIFLALVKELQKRNNISEIDAFKKVYVQWWQSGRDGATRELLFEEVFGFSLNSFYESLKSYTPDINTVLPSENIRLEEIFEEL